MKRFLSAAVCICLILLTAAWAVGADSGITAVNVVVLEYEGTVDVVNQSGRSVPVFSNMRLHSGYEVSTLSASYAWMSLDDTKVAGLDADSNMSVKKQGKQLVLLLDQGNMFFDVQKKLEKDETMNVRTSNMVMGIRGTFGEVRAVDSCTTEVLCLDGKLQIRVFDPAAGSTAELELTPGQIALFRVGQEQTDAGTILIQVREYAPEEIDGFVLRYLNRNRSTLERIAQSGGGDLDSAASDWETRLKADEAERSERAAQAEAGEEPEQRISYWEHAAPCADGHQNVRVSSVQSTCTAGGQNIYYCSVCGMQTIESVPPLPHQYEGIVCINCGQRRSDSSDVAGSDYTVGPSDPTVKY